MVIFFNWYKKYMYIFLVKYNRTSIRTPNIKIGFHFISYMSPLNLHMSMLTAFTMGLAFTGLLLFSNFCNFWRVKPSSGLFLVYQLSSWEFTPGFRGREPWSYLALLRTIIGVCCYPDSIIRLSLLEVILVQLQGKNSGMDQDSRDNPLPWVSLSTHAAWALEDIFFLRVQFTVQFSASRLEEDRNMKGSLTFPVCCFLEKYTVKKPIVYMLLEWMILYCVKKTNQTNHAQ